MLALRLRAGSWYVGDQRLSMSEASILLCLAFNGAISRDDLMEIYWPHPDDMPEYWYRIIGKNLCRLRRKITPFTIYSPYQKIYYLRHWSDVQSESRRARYLDNRGRIAWGLRRREQPSGAPVQGHRSDDRGAP